MSCMSLMRTSPRVAGGVAIKCGLRVMRSSNLKCQRRTHVVRRQNIIFLVIPPFGLLSYSGEYVGIGYRWPANIYAPKIL